MGLKQVSLAEIILQMENGPVEYVEVQSANQKGEETHAVDALAWLYERERERQEHPRETYYAYQWHRALKVWQFYFTDVRLAFEFKMNWG